jgi:hypothetical protein
MLDAIFYFFVLLTPVFAVYWVLSMAFLAFGKSRSAGSGFLEFMRLWLKPLFWMNFMYYLAIEAVFTAVYWFGYVLSKTTAFPVGLNLLGRIFAPLYNALFRMIPTSSGGDTAVETWIFLSLVLFAIIMIPYMVVHFGVTGYFKKFVFKTITDHLRIPHARFVTQKPDTMLDSGLVNAVVSQDATAREWIRKTFEEQSPGYGGDPKKFSLSATNADHMQWQLDNLQFDFWESEIQIEKKTPRRDSEDKLSYNSDYHTCFDGLVIRVNDFLPAGYETALYIVDSESRSADHRPAHEQGFLISLIEILGGKGMGLHKDESSTSLQDFPDSLFSLELENARNLRFVGTDGTSLLLFAESHLSGTMFDFNQNIPVSQSIELFSRDLEFVVEHCSLAYEVKQALDKLKTENVAAIA